MNKKRPPFCPVQRGGFYMNKTQNYNLNQWDPTDPIRREDFNADNAVIDAALDGKANFAFGSYTGTGTYGASGPTKITFPFVPKLAIIVGATYGGYRTIYLNGCTSLMTRPTNTNVFVDCSLSGCTLSLTNDDSAENQLNIVNYTYIWAALG